MENEIGKKKNRWLEFYYEYAKNTHSVGNKRYRAAVEAYREKYPKKVPKNPRKKVNFTKTDDDSE